MVQRWVGQAVLPSVRAGPACVSVEQGRMGLQADWMPWDLPFAVCTFTFDLRPALALSYFFPR